MYELNVTELANDDLERIVLYISENLANKKAASDFLIEVEKCYDYLRSNPYIYQKCDEIPLSNSGYRKALIKNYILIFKVNEDEKRTTIYRFFYAARDYFKLL